HLGAIMIQFLIHPPLDGRAEFGLYSGRGDALLRSSAMHPALVAAAIARLKAFINDDWRYRIGRDRHGGIFFTLDLPKTNAVCTSPAYGSCEAMELAIAALKECVPLAPLVYLTHVDPSAAASGPTKHARDPVARNRRLAGAPAHPACVCAPG